MKPNSLRSRALVAFAVLGLAGSAQAQDVTVGGVGYAEYLYQLSDSAHYNAFDVTRAYVNVRGKFDHGISTRITSDLYRAADGSYDLRIKYAYVSLALAKAPIAFSLGQIQTPWVAWQEDLWGYRMQGTVPLDRAGYLTSADLGLSAIGDFLDDALTLHLAVVNGEGYHAAESSSSKDVEGRASVRLLRSDVGGSQGGLRLSGYAGLGSSTGGGLRNRFVGELSWKSSLATLVGEYAIARTRTGPESPTNPNVPGRVASVFGVLNVPDSPISVIGRLDVVDPNTDLDGDRHTVVIGGIAYKVSPNLRLLADIDHTGYQTQPPSAVYDLRNKGLLQVEFSF